MDTADPLNSSSQHRTRVRAHRSTRRIGVLAAIACIASSIYVDRTQAAISSSQPLQVRILLDNSGSMYPGYQPGTGQSKSALGVKFYREYPEFRSWLADFVTRQAMLNGRTVSLAAFTSNDSFRPGSDIVTVHDSSPLSNFDVDAALDKVTGYGRKTFLAESLDVHSKDFEGLVWLITDNIVETGQGTADEGVVNFFRSLKNKPKYRSVHLFKLPFADPDLGHHSAIAIYGILVSPQDVPDAGHFDDKFRNQLRVARRPATGQKLFPGEEHLKLKDLSVDALKLEIPKLEVEIRNLRDLFSEQNAIQLRLPCKISSKLTQHSVVKGKYTLTVIEPFEAKEPARSAYGVRAIPADSFNSFRGQIQQPIPPIGQHKFVAEISSIRSLSLAPSGFWAWIKVAVFGLQAEFTSRARMTFEDIDLRLERERMAGIFGVDEASSVFDLQDVRNIPVQPAYTQVSFVLGTGNFRSLVLLLVLLILALPLGYGIWFLQRKANYRVTIGTNPGTVVGLRRLGSYRIYYPPHVVGRLVRGLDGRHQLRPNPEISDFRSASATRSGGYSATLPDGKQLSLTIEALDSKHQEAKGPAGHGKVRRPTAGPAPAVSNSGAKPKRAGGEASPSPPKPRRPSRPKPTIRRPR